MSAGGDSLEDVTSTLRLDRPGWRTWTLWIVGVLAYVVSIVNRTSLSAVGVDAAVRFGADASALSMFAVIQLFVYGAMQIPVGLLLDRFGARPMIAIGMVLMAVGQLVMAFADAVGIGILARVLIGAGDAAIFPSVLRVIATWFPAQRAPLLVQLTASSASSARSSRSSPSPPSCTPPAGASPSAASRGWACSSRS